MSSDETRRAEEELRQAERDKAVVLHVERGVVGVAARFWEPGTYVPRPQTRTREAGGVRWEVEVELPPISEAVLELSDGNALLARPGSFVVLGEAESAVFRTVVSNLRELAAGAFLVLASAPHPNKATALALVRSALRAQLRALGGSEGG
jgi:hypothetical protein